MSRIYKEDSHINLNRNIQHSYSPLQYNHQVQRANYTNYSPRTIQNNINTPVRRVSITHHQSSIDGSKDNNNNSPRAYTNYSNYQPQQPYFSGIKHSTFISDPPYMAQTVSKFGNTDSRRDTSQSRRHKYQDPELTQPIHLATTSLRRSKIQQQAESYHPFEKDSSFIDYSQRQLRPQQVSMSQLNSRPKTTRNSYRPKERTEILGKRRSTEAILGMDSKDLLSPFKETEVYEDKSLIWKKFQEVNDDLKPEIKEIINNLTQTVVDASHCFLDLFNLFSRAELIDEILKRKDQIEKMADLTSKACSLFKIELAQHIRQNKEHLRYQSSGTLEEISMISEKMMKQMRSSFRPSYNIFKNEMIDLSLISDPELRFIGLTKNEKSDKEERKRSEIYIEPAMDEEHQNFKKSYSKNNLLKRSEYFEEMTQFNYLSGPQTMKNSLLASYERRLQRTEINKKQEKISRSSPVRDASLVRGRPNFAPPENVFIKPKPIEPEFKLPTSRNPSSRSIKNRSITPPGFSRETSRTPNNRKNHDFFKGRKSLTPSPKRTIFTKEDRESNFQRSKTPKSIHKNQKIFPSDKSKEKYQSKTSRSRIPNHDLQSENLRTSLYSKYSESGQGRVPSDNTSSTRRDLFNKAQTDGVGKKRYQSRVSQSNISNLSENPNNLRDLSNSSANRRKSKSLKRKRVSKANYLKKGLSNRFSEENSEELPMDNSEDSYVLKNFFGIYNVMNTSVQNIDLKDSFKLTLNSLADRLYLTGKKGTQILQCERSGRSHMFQENRKDKAGCMISCNRDNDILIQDPATNDLVHLDRNLVELNRHKGNDINFNYSLDDYYTLWRQGKESLSVVDRRNFRIVNAISDFFVYKSTTTKAISACASRDASKILGISQHPVNDRYILHYFECDEDRVERLRTKYLQRVFPEMSEVCDVEVSKNSSRAYLGGVNKFNGKAMLVCAEFVRNLNVVCYTVLDQLDFGKPRVIKRIKGYEILIIGCNYHYCIVEFKNMKFEILACINDVHKSRILDFEYKNQLIFSIGENDSDLKVISFGKNDAIETMDHRHDEDKMSAISISSKRKLLNKNSSGRPSAEPVFNKTEFQNDIVTPKKYKKNSPRASTSFNSAIMKKSPSNAKGMMLSNPKNSQISIKGLNGLEKIAISLNGRRVYVGGKGLNIIQKGPSGNYSTISKQGLKGLNYFSIKATNSKHVVVQENGTNDLVVLDKLGNEVTRLIGKEKFFFGESSMRNTHFSQEGDIMVWFSGKSSLSVVDMTNLSAQEITGILPYTSENDFSVAMRCVARENGARIIVVFLKNKIFQFAYYIRGKTNPIYHTAEKILPSFKKISAIELSYHQDVIYIAGSSSHIPTLHSKGVIAACVFERNMSLLVEKSFNKDDVRDCTSMKRLPKSDVLAVGGYKHLYLVQYSKKKFTSLFVFNNIHSGYICDLCLNGRNIYSICDEDEYIATTSFSEEL